MFNRSQQRNCDRKRTTITNSLECCNRIIDETSLLKVEQERSETLPEHDSLSWNKNEK